MAKGSVQIVNVSLILAKVTQICAFLDPLHSLHMKRMISSTLYLVILSLEEQRMDKTDSLSE